MSEKFSQNEVAKHVPTKRRWGFLPIIDFYVFREFMIPLTVLFLAFLILFLIGDMINDLSDFLDAKSPFPVIARYFLLKFPGNIRFIMPISLLLSCMYTMAHFGKNREVTAMRASGISLMRCGGAIYIVALIVTGLNFWFNEKLVPSFEKEALIIQKRAVNPEWVEEQHRMLQYRSSDQTRTWLFKNFDINGVQQDVILKKYIEDETGERKLSWDLKAKDASFIPSKGWEFRDVILTPYSKGFMPGNPEHYEKLLKEIDEVPETPAHIMKSVSPPEDLSSFEIMTLVSTTKNMHPSLKSVYWTVFFSRIVFPWSCLLAVLLGIPFAAKNERGGIFLSIVMAVGVIVVYQLVSNFCIVLGKQGILPPFIAGAGPTLVFLVYGWYAVIHKNS